MDPCESVQVAQNDTMSAFSTMIDTESIFDDHYSESAISEEPSLCIASVSAPQDIPKESDQIQTLIETHQKELAAILKYVKERKIAKVEGDDAPQTQSASKVEDVGESITGSQTTLAADVVPFSASIPPVFNSYLH